MWERLHYDWSDPSRIVMTTTDSNRGAATPATPTRSRRSPTGRPSSTTVVIREGKNLKGRLLGLVLGSIGKGKLAKAFANTVKAIETRSDASRSARSLVNA